jgi:hypothetical protein
MTERQRNETREKLDWDKEIKIAKRLIERKTHTQSLHQNYKITTLSLKI